jgi:hypothetical protein
MDLTAVIRELRALNEPVLKPLRLPTLAEVDAAEAATGFTFPLDYRRFLLEASDVVFGTIEPAVVIVPDGRGSLPHLVNHARGVGVPAKLLPFCEDNGDYYCLDAVGEVVYWSHNGTTDEHWPDLATWIKQVWIDEYHEGTEDDE